jgi:hypothetical protein
MRSPLILTCFSSWTRPGGGFGRGCKCSVVHNSGVRLRPRKTRHAVREHLPVSTTKKIIAGRHENSKHFIQTDGYVQVRNQLSQDLDWACEKRRKHTMSLCSQAQEASDWWNPYGPNSVWRETCHFPNVLRLCVDCSHLLYQCTMKYCSFFSEAWSIDMHSRLVGYSVQVAWW